MKWHYRSLSMIAMRDLCSAVAPAQKAAGTSHVLVTLCCVYCCLELIKSPECRNTKLCPEGAHDRCYACYWHYLHGKWTVHPLRSKGPLAGPIPDIPSPFHSLFSFMHTLCCSCFDQYNMYFAPLMVCQLPCKAYAAPPVLLAMS